MGNQFGHLTIWAIWHQAKPNNADHIACRLKVNEIENGFSLYWTVQSVYESLAIEAWVMIIILLN